MTPNNSTDQIRRKKRAATWNILTVVVILATICLLYYFVTLFRDPRSWMNPFKPEPSPTVFYTATSTITPIQQPPTWTPTETIKPADTRTRAPTWTPYGWVPSETFTLTPSETKTPAITDTPMPASAEITYYPSTQYHPSSGCEWMGVAGVVLGLDGTPLQFQTIQLGGMLDEVVISQLKLSGSAPLYGDSGFEFELGNQPIASTESIWIQLFDNTGSAMTERIFFDTFEDCSQNLVMVTFTRDH